MRPTVTEVLNAAEAARTRGSVYLCVELVQLAGSMIPGVQDNANTAARLAFLAVNDRMPLAAPARHSYLEGSRR